MEIETKTLNIFLDDRGYLFEALRKDDKLFSGIFGQVTVSTIFPGVIKAWHRHYKQTDYTFCVSGNLKLLLAQEKGASVEIKEFYLGEKKPLLVKIPPGIWHGYTPLGNKKATIVYLTDTTYNPNDEERKDWRAFGDVWAVKNK